MKRRYVRVVLLSICVPPFGLACQDDAGSAAGSMFGTGDSSPADDEVGDGEVGDGDGDGDGDLGDGDPDPGAE